MQFTITYNRQGIPHLSYEGRHPLSNQEANQLSVLKWETFLKHLEMDELMDMGSGIPTCGYCMLYFTNGCEGCPISEKTGKIGCRDTPHDEYIYLTDEVENTIWGIVDEDDDTTDTISDEDRKYVFDELKAITRREITFLKSLEPELWKEVTE